MSRVRVLVVGGGGREHALCWKLAQEADVCCLPGNPGISEVAQCVDGDILNPDHILESAKRFETHLVLFGPEAPLIAGVADTVREAGYAVLGPGKEAARLEGSKSFAKALMQRTGVPTATHASFTDTAQAIEFAEARQEVGRQVVVKADGNALGKGVIVCANLEEAKEAIRSMLDDNRFGDASTSIVVEERLSGPEFSLLTVCSDFGFYSLPVAQDYKRAYDGDCGPNTGGMGSFAPANHVTPDQIKKTEETVVHPVLEALRSAGNVFRGVLFAGMLIHEGTPHCLEFNVRFGDPETQSIVRLIGSGFADLLLSAAKGEPLPKISSLPGAAVSVVLASEGYPGPIETGRPIEIGPTLQGVELFHAGTKVSEGKLVTSGGRVLAVSAVGQSVLAARNLAYQGVEAVAFDGAWHRKDIAAAM